MCGNVRSMRHIRTNKVTGYRFYEDDFGNRLAHVHPVDRCKNTPCPIDIPSNHHMRNWKQLWRADRAILERVCCHGVGHPDPDGKTLDERHGCDGCCVPPGQRPKPISQYAPGLTDDERAYIRQLARTPASDVTSDTPSSQRQQSAKQSYSRTYKISIRCTNCGAYGSESVPYGDPARRRREMNCVVCGTMSTWEKVIK